MNLNLNVNRFILNFGQLFYRNYAFKSDLKIKWVRPEKIPCILPEKSGDLSLLPAIDTKSFIPDYENSKELANADEATKLVFQLENNPRRYTTLLYRRMFIKNLQRHPFDTGSMEARIADMTANIRCLQENFKEHPRNPELRVKLKETIDKRKKYLKYLRRWDYKRFEWMLEKLDLVYKPPPNEFHWITRKESLRKLTNIHCENIKTERLNEYRKILEEQQVDFLEKKIKTLEFIANEQKECNVPITITENDIENVRKQLNELKIKRKNETDNVK